VDDRYRAAKVWLINHLDSKRLQKPIARGDSTSKSTSLRQLPEAMPTVIFGVASPDVRLLADTGPFPQSYRTAGFDPKPTWLGSTKVQPQPLYVYSAEPR
jgi:hypothetical protein